MRDGKKGFSGDMLENRWRKETIGELTDLPADDDDERGDDGR